MSYKEIFVHLDSGGRSHLRARLAADLARRFTARLTGLFADCDPYLANLASRNPEAIHREAAATMETVLRTEAGDGGPAVDLDTAIVRRDSDLSRAVIAGARYSDLAILGQFDPQEPISGVPADLCENVVLNSGRPVLIVPFAGAFPTIGKRIMVAWNAGREATRATHDALPFLAGADLVTVLEINPHRGRRGQDAGDALVRHLSVHGIGAKSSVLVSTDASAMDLLLSRIADDGVDLLVMGAHGHYDFPHLQRGGSTRHILKHMTVPVLMSH